MSNDFSRPQVMACPACGASLALPDKDSFDCDYCGNHILVPQELRPRRTISGPEIIRQGSAKTVQPDWQVVVTPTSTDANTIRQKRKVMITFFAIGIMVVIFAMVGALLFIIPFSRSENAIEYPTPQAGTTPLPTMVLFSRLAMVFGSEGNQPGQFDDARSIAVDNRGNIFVADYSTGRINKFDPQGNFLQLIQIKTENGNDDVYISGLSTDDLGNLYAAAKGEILKFNSETGELVLTIPDQWPEIYFNSVVVAPDGNLYSTNGMAGADDVIILSPEGQLLAHWTDTIETVNHDDPTMELVLGVNNSGKVYILSPMGNRVYSYNPDGTFSFSFGEPGEHAGQLDLSTSMLAITEQDYLVISDVYRVDLFDANGVYLNRSFTIDYKIAEGSMFGMTMDPEGDLYYISSGGKVLKFDMNYP
jgi:sugar lactone lactonase YvrE